MQDDQRANAVRDAVSRLNQALADAARANLAVKLSTTAHQTASGVERIVVEARIYKQL